MHSARKSASKSVIITIPVAQRRQILAPHVSAGKAAFHQNSVIPSVVRR